MARSKSRAQRNHDDVLFFLRASVEPGRKLDLALAKQTTMDGVWIVSRPPKDTSLVLHGHWPTWSDDGFDEEDTIALIGAVAKVATEGRAAIQLEGGVDGPYYAAFTFKAGKLTRKNLVPDPYSPTEEQLARFDALWADDPPATIRRGPPRAGKTKPR